MQRVGFLPWKMTTPEGLEVLKKLFQDPTKR